MCWNKFCEVIIILFGKYMKKKILIILLLDYFFFYFIFYVYIKIECFLNIYDNYRKNNKKKR